MTRAICMQCDGFMESKGRHDFVRCSCGMSFVDGGGEYFRAGGFTHGVPDDIMTAEEFWQWLDELDKQMEEEENGKQ